MISPADAQRIVLDTVVEVGAMTVSLPRALGCVLARTVVAQEEVPGFANSSMDGYAVRSQDVQSAPTELTLVGEIAAGIADGRSLRAGEATAIMTGGKIPDGCDAVVQVEWTDKVDASRVRILQSVKAGHNIRPAGSDIPNGSVVMEKGQFLRPFEVGVLSSLGLKFVEISRPPRVAILTTGNEVVEIDKELSPGQIRNSNMYSLLALVEDAGAEAVNIGIARDDRADIRQKMSAGLKFDVLISSGGVSAGAYDLVIDALKDQGGEVKFWKVNMKPGMPLMFGMCRGVPVFGLPGNPVSTVVTFLQFVKPALFKMMGRIVPSGAARFYAILDMDIDKKDDKRHFIRGIFQTREGKTIVRSTGTQLSSALTSLVRANCLIVLPEGKKLFRKGESVEVELL